MKLYKSVKKLQQMKQLIMNVKGAPIRLSKNFTAENLQARMGQEYIFKVLKEKEIANQEYSSTKLSSKLKEK